MLLQHNGDGDWAKANALLDESLPISNEMGMKPLMERVLSRREILGTWDILVTRFHWIGVGLIATPAR